MEAKEYILDLYRQSFPEKLPGARHVGPEEEYIVVNARGERGDTTPLFDDLVTQGWKPKLDPVTKRLVGATQGELVVEMDVGAGTLEIGFVHVENLLTHVPTRKTILKNVDEGLTRHGLYRLNDYAVQPVTHPEPDHWGPKGRSEFFRGYFPREVDVQTASAASQVHIDITRAEIIPVLEMLLSLSAVLTALSANAPVWGGRLDPKGLLASRQDFWDRFTIHTGHWQNVHLGDPALASSHQERAPYSLEELADWIASARFLIHIEGDKLHSPQKPFRIWFDENRAQLDVAMLRQWYQSHEGTLWWEVRPRVAYGTIEVRPCCQSARALNITALILGLIENTQAALTFVRHTNSFSGWRTWHQACLKDGLHVNMMPEITRQVLSIAEQGLKQRGFGEEELLEPLRPLIESNSSPGHSKKELFLSKGLDALVDFLL